MLVSSANPQPPTKHTMKRIYLIVSKEGMVPYAECNTLRDARRLSREARQLGLSGEIVTRFRVVSRIH